MAAGGVAMSKGRKSMELSSRVVLSTILIYEGIRERGFHFAWPLCEVMVEIGLSCKVVFSSQTRKVSVLE